MPDEGHAQGPGIGSRADMHRIMRYMPELTRRLREEYKEYGPMGTTMSVASTKYMMAVQMVGDFDKWFRQ